MNGRTIVVGDLQGCYNETIKLLEKCKATADDHVIFAGDLVDRGPDGGKCIDLAIRREAIQGKPASILGNHEERHLHYRDLEDKGRTVNVTVPSHVATRLQLEKRHYDYIRRMPLFIRLPEHNAVVVHAGVYPGRPIEAQDPHHLLHIQMIQPYDKWGNPTRNMRSIWPSRVPDNEDGWGFWTKFWDGPERVIFGHSVFDKPLITDKVCGIDGGCCFGRDLHAVILPSWEIVTVKGTVDYGKGVRGRPSEEEVLRGAHVRKFLIHDDVSTFS